MTFQNRTAVITGASRGIGEAIARELAGLGAAVVLAARSTNDVERIAHDLRQSGADAHGVACDVTDPEAVGVLHETAVEAVGPIDILVNNAGRAWSAPLAKIDLDTWSALFAVNVTGVLLCTQRFVPDMQQRGWGRVINVASIAGKIGAPYIAAYAATKHAVVGFTRSVAAELATTGVTVNAICPGYVDTDMTGESIERIVAKTGISAEEALRNIESASPQRRLFEASEVAYLVRVLCDDRSRGVTGQSLVLDGGGVQS